MISREAWDLLPYADLYRKGLAPEPGGALDQAAGFTTACRFVWSEQERIKAEMLSEK